METKTLYKINGMISLTKGNRYYFSVTTMEVVEKEKSYVTQSKHHREQRLKKEIVHKGVVTTESISDISGKAYTFDQNEIELIKEEMIQSFKNRIELSIKSLEKAYKHLQTEEPAIKEYDYDDPYSL